MKIPVTIGKGTDTAKPRSKAPSRGNKDAQITSITAAPYVGSKHNTAAIQLPFQYKDAL